MQAYKKTRYNQVIASRNSEIIQEKNIAMEIHSPKE